MECKHENKFITLIFCKFTYFTIVVSEKNVITPCLQQLDPNILSECHPGLMYILKEVYNSVTPNLENIPYV